MPTTPVLVALGLTRGALPAARRRHRLTAPRTRSVDESRVPAARRPSEDAAALTAAVGFEVSSR